MAFPRGAGILLHPTSLPGREGIGKAGAEARRFVDTLAQCRLNLWQILPLGPTGYGNSPYAGLSAFAGNPLLVALEPLAEAGLLDQGDLQALPSASETSVDFGAVLPTTMSALRRAFARFQARAERQELTHFCDTNRAWLEDFGLYMAIKDAHGGAPWFEWEPALRRRDPDALSSARAQLESDIRFHQWMQFEFFTQWESLKHYTNGRGVQIVGDIPIFVAHDSADVWAHQELFRLTEDGEPEVQAGVPPDYFSATGQLWGNPHYRWDVMEDTGFQWWIERFRALLRLVDIVRLDHFRGFAAAWAVPHGDTTAERGEWVPAPGRALFEALQSALGRLPIIAEDLGVITPDVVELRRRFGFPGMVILQFAFASDASDPSLPHNLDRDSVVYTGTHDNDTTVGWFSSISTDERRWVQRYLRTQGLDISWDLIRAAFTAGADMAIVPLQDVLRLGTKARMNFPGRPEGNWAWRFSEGDLTDLHLDELKSLAVTYGRASQRADSPVLVAPDLPPPAI